ncbi:hypothetical protein XM53_18730 [Roseovarius atlanticus]|uniref:DUF58 domain-containing protein n=1 Tax=Roseovarius atlanticus TaxID=1641875 RepID=A0A0T5NQH7_9RHOB|nr:DUF58 domain-containing protein [Roseovarius atlanticus]KRS10958.1 hypothetical protein XM53_18730 [Roseovarius atlanticus]
MSAALEQPGVRLAAGDLIALRAHALTGPGGAEQCATLPGGHATRVKGQGIEVADIRDYLPGDDIRHLDRASTARTGKLHVRQFQAERDRVRYLVADMRSEMLWGLRRALLSVAAAEALVLDAWPLIEQGGRVGLLAVTDRDVTVVPPRGRIRGMLDVIGGLVEAHARALEDAARDKGASGGALSLDRALHRLERLAPSGSEIVIASGFDAPGEELVKVLDGLGQRRAIRLLLVSNTEALPAGRYPVRLADGRRTNLRIGANDAVPTAVRIAGREALVVDAGADPREIARVLIRYHDEHAA